MSLLNRFSIRARISAGLSIILAMAILSAGYGYFRNLSTKYEASEIPNSWIPAIENLDKMKGHIADHYVAVSEQMASGRPPEAAVLTQLQTLQDQLAAATQVYAKTLETYQPDNPKGPIEKGMYQAYQQKIGRYFQSTQAALAQLQTAGTDPEQLNRVQTDFNRTIPAAFREAFQDINAIFKFNLEGTAEAGMVVLSGIEQTEFYNLLAAAFMVTAGGLLIWTIPLSVTRPVDAAVQAAQTIAEGDLTHRIDATSQDELGHLLRSLETMRQRLASVVANVRQGSESVATASAEIAQGNHDLSARTEAQAAALEESSASMAELGTNVGHNAQAAEEANQLALNASRVAEQGGHVVSEVVHTMRGIHESSQKINDIIGVIDSIAFQTNILALNAAVEAARAGEQGRGFAVVAAEVRALASRSAEAAKEIKGLISASVERVAHGSHLVDQAGLTMGEVVSAIQRVTGIMQDISAASRDQSAGVNQVAEAVQQMDRSTQQNAALVEEMAAAAVSLKNQAHDLVSTVAVFKVATGRPT